MGYDKIRRPLAGIQDQSRFLGVEVSTAATAAASTKLAAGIYGLRTTSTAAPVVYTMRLPKSGEFLAVTALAIQSSSMAPIHINAGPTTDTYWNNASQMLTLATQDSGFYAIAQSSSQWLVVGQVGTIAFTTST